MKQTKNHGGYFACDYCKTKGTYGKGAVSYPEVNFEERTDEDFKLKTQPEHHTGISPLEKIGLPMVSSFPIDFMHCVLLGTTRRMLSIWCNKIPYKLKYQDKVELNDKMYRLRASTPSDFSRKPKSIFDVDRWKATECYSFLLYYGPIVLQNILPQDRYEHFCLLFTAIRIFCIPGLVAQENLLEFAHQLLVKFISDYSALYPQLNVVFNIHQLQHLKNHVARYGTLQTFSAFKYENFLGGIKRKIKSGSLPLQQLIARMSEEENFFNKKTSQKPIASSSRNLGNKLVLASGEINISQVKNSYVLLNNGYPGLIKNIDLRHGKADVELFMNYKAASFCSSIPVPYDTLGYYEYASESKRSLVNIDQIYCKCWRIYNDGKAYMITMI